MVTQGSSDTSIRLFFSDISAFIEIFFSFTNGKLKLHELFPSIQSNWHQCQALDTHFSDEGADFRTSEQELA